VAAGLLAMTAAVAASANKAMIAPFFIENKIEWLHKQNRLWQEDGSGGKKTQKRF